MKTESSLFESLQARFTQFRRAVKDLHTEIASESYGNEVKPIRIKDMRSLVEEINQCFHEFSAYWNVLNTN